MRGIEFEEPPPLRVTLALAGLRMVAGLILVAHGWQKLLGFQPWHAQLVLLGVPQPDVAAWLVVAAELFGGLGLILGLITRLAAAGALCVMVGAIATVHWYNGLFAQDGGFEYPLTLGTVALVFLTLGGGRLSVDRVRRERARRRAIDADDRWQRPPYVPSTPPPVATATGSVNLDQALPERSSK